MDISEYTTEELIALASGLSLPDPVTIRGSPAANWPPAVRDEVVRIGLRSLAARQVVRLGEDRNPEIPDIIAALLRVICTAELLIQVVRVDGGLIHAVAFLVTPTDSAGQRLTSLGNHRFTLFPTAHVGEALAEVLAIAERPRTGSAAGSAYADQYQALLDAARTAGPDDSIDTLLRRSGITGTLADLIRSVSVDGTTATAVQVLHSPLGGHVVEGSLTSFIDAGAGGLWIATSTTDADRGQPRVDIAPASRSAIMASIVEGLPDWFEASGSLRQG